MKKKGVYTYNVTNIYIYIYISSGTYTCRSASFRSACAPKMHDCWTKMCVSWQTDYSVEVCSMCFVCPPKVVGSPLHVPLRLPSPVRVAAPAPRIPYKQYYIYIYMYVCIDCMYVYQHTYMHKYKYK